jgi:hypothetical protein
MEKQKEMSQEDQDKFEEGKEMFHQISRSLNIMGNDFYIGKGFMEALKHEHPTLSQAFFRKMVIPIIQHYNELYEKNWYDMRNEATCKICHEMWKDLKDVAIPFI